VVPNISHETLAEMVGTTRSRVCFFMKRFKDSALSTTSAIRSRFEFVVPLLLSTPRKNPDRRRVHLGFRHRIC